MNIRTPVLAVLAALAAAAIGLSGCATTQHEEDISLFDDAVEREATISVTNNNWSDMTVFVVRSGMRTRLGNVGSMSSGEFSIPSGVVASAASVQLMAIPLAARSGYVSQNLSIMPGQQIVLQLENNLNLSSFTIR